MLSFFVKKAFFDGWDHLFGLVLENLGFLALIALGVFLPPLFGTATFGFYACLVLVVFLASIWWATALYSMVGVADYASLSLRDFPKYLRAALIPGLQFGLLSCLVGAAVLVGLPFYLSRGGMIGAAAAGLLIWCSLFFALAFQWFLPLKARFGGGFAKNLKKCLILALDNSFFSLFIFVYSLLSLVLSILLAFLLPGFAGMALGLDDALKIRVLKYDWIEANPGAKKNEVPWDELLREEKELVGKRSLRGMIFPWKE